MTTKRFLIIQVRPEDEAAENEFEAFLKFGGLLPHEVDRFRADKESIPPIDLSAYAGVIVGGGPSNISDKEKTEVTQRMERDIYRLLDEIVENDIPYLGACYGFGALVVHQNAKMSKQSYSEPVGATTITLTREGQRDALLKDLPTIFRAFCGHKEACQTTPIRATVLAGSDACPVQIIRLKQNIYATQFHPELDTEGTIVRINVYKHAGYFLPEDAEDLIATVKEEKVTVPVKILSNFIERYR